MGGGTRREERVTKTFVYRGSKSITKDSGVFDRARSQEERNDLLKGWLDENTEGWELHESVLFAKMDGQLDAIAPFKYFREYLGENEGVWAKSGNVIAVDTPGVYSRLWVEMTEEEWGVDGVRMFETALKLMDEDRKEQLAGRQPYEGQLGRLREKLRRVNVPS